VTAAVVCIVEMKVAAAVACIVEMKVAAAVACIVEMKVVAAVACIVETTAAAVVACIVEMKAAAAAAAAVVGIVEMKPGTVVVVGATKAVHVVSRVELKAAAGIGAAKTVAAANSVELKAVAAAACIETTKAAAVARVLLDILRPHAGTGNTGLEQSATDFVAQRAVAGVVGAFGFVAIRGAEVDLQEGNTQTDIPDSDLDMKGFEPDRPDPGHRCTVEY
jgi:hypothetical protein